LDVGALHEVVEEESGGGLRRRGSQSGATLERGTGAYAHGPDKLLGTALDRLIWVDLTQHGGDRR